jgi:plastocyanin
MKKLAALLVLALASLALVACGGGDNNTTTTTGGGETGGAAAGNEKAAGGGGSTVSFEADPNGEIAFTSDSATAKTGNVTIEFNNPQALPHDVRIEDSSGKDIGGTEQISESSASASVNLKPGTYTFFCSVPGHREAGMEGTLTVK